MTSPLTDGLLELTFTADRAGRTRLLNRQQRYPLQITTALPGDHICPGMVVVIIQSPSGGLFPGDDVHIRIRAGAGARVRVTTASATKVYRGAGKPARQTIEITAAPGAFVEYAPQQLIPHAGSEFVQECVFSVDDGAAVVATEQVSPGRYAHGEAFAYHGLTLSTEVRAGPGRRLAVDRMIISPHSPDASVFPLEGFPYFGTVVVACQHDPAGVADRIDGVIADSETTLAGAGEMPNGAGALARVLAASSHELAHSVGVAAAAARRAALDVVCACKPGETR